MEAVMFKRLVLGRENVEEVSEYLEFFLLNQGLFIIKNELTYSYEPEEIITLNITENREIDLFFTGSFGPLKVHQNTSLFFQDCTYYKYVLLEESSCSEHVELTKNQLTTLGESTINTVWKITTQPPKIQNR